MNFFIKFFRSLLVSKYYFHIPLKKKYLILDETNKLYFNKFCPKHQAEYIKINSLNIYVIFKLLLKDGISTKSFMLRYFINYIKLSEPAFFITKIDNNPIFWQLKNFVPNVKIIIIQNGWRMKKYDIFENVKNDKKYKADLFLTFNNAISAFYSKFINAKFITLGCIENNFNKIQLFKNSKSILFISDYIGKSDSFFFKKNKINSHEWYKPEFFLLPYLKKYCLKKNYNLIICPRTFLKNEYLFYRKILGDSDWKFLDKKKICAYNEIDKSSISISISSTLGYEALARGKKAIFFSCRKTRGVSASFGWPKYHQKKEGFFWINYLSLKKFEIKLNNIMNMSKYEWKSKSAKYKSNLMCYNNNNSILKQILKTK